MTDKTAAEILAQVDEEMTTGPWEAREMLHHGKPGTGFGYVVHEGEEIMGEESASGLLANARGIAMLRNLLPELRAVLVAVEESGIYQPNYNEASRVDEALKTLDHKARELAGGRD